MNPCESLSQLFKANTEMLKAYLKDLKGPELIVQLPGQGQHALWLMTHIVMVEDRAINTWVLGRPHAMDDRWMAAVMPGSQAQPDPAAYPSQPALLEMLDTVRANTLDALSSLRESDWDKPARPNAPPIMPTVGSVFYRMPMHASFHAGELAAIRHMLGRPPVYR